MSGEHDRSIHDTPGGDAIGREVRQIRSETARDTALLATLQEMSGHLANIAIAAMHSTGAVVATVDPEGKLGLRLPTEGEQLARQFDAPSAPPDLRVFPAETVPHKGTRAWVFKPPAFISDVELDCFGDESAPLGMRCVAVKKLPGNERVKYDVAFAPKE